MENFKGASLSAKGNENTSELNKLQRDEKKPLVYPPVVIAHITNDIADLFRPRLTGKESVQLHYSAQMNSHPHLGTVLSLRQLLE